MFAALLAAGTALLVTLVPSDSGRIGGRRLTVAGWLAALPLGGWLGCRHGAGLWLGLALRRHLLLELDVRLAVVGEHRQIAFFGEGGHAAVDRLDPLSTADEAGLAFLPGGQH